MSDSYLEDQLFRIIQNRNRPWIDAALARKGVKAESASFQDIADQRLDSFAIGRLETPVEQAFSICLPLNTRKGWVVEDYRNYILNRIEKPLVVNSKLARERAGDLELGTVLFWSACIIGPTTLWYLVVTKFTLLGLIGAIFLTFFLLFPLDGFLTYRYYSKLASKIESIPNPST